MKRHGSGACFFRRTSRHGVGLSAALCELLRVFVKAELDYSLIQDDYSHSKHVSCTPAVMYMCQNMPPASTQSPDQVFGVASMKHMMPSCCCGVCACCCRCCCFRCCALREPPLLLARGAGTSVTRWCRLPPGDDAPRELLFGDAPASEPLMTTCRRIRGHMKCSDARLM